MPELVSHKTRICSLYLDECFGTLGQETLKTVLCALDSLNASSKMVGIIAQIESLTRTDSNTEEVTKEAELGTANWIAALPLPLITS